MKAQPYMPTVITYAVQSANHKEDQNSKPKYIEVQHIAHPKPKQPEEIINCKGVSSDERSSSKENIRNQPNEDIQMKQEKYIMMGGLGPNTGSEEWLKSKKKKECSEDFAKNVKQLNKEKLSKQPKKEPPKRKLPPKGSSTREKAKEFAKKILKPVNKPISKTLYVEPKEEPKDDGSTNKQYNELEAKNEDYKKKIEEIKRQMNIK